MVVRLFTFVNYRFDGAIEVRESLPYKYESTLHKLYS
jgi:hypothetical protein